MTKRGSGLLMFTPTDKVFLILLNSPYPGADSSNNVRIPGSFTPVNHWPPQNGYYHRGFLEKFSIPRGQKSKKAQREDDLTTAIREFLEETQIKINQFNLVDQYFNLYWVDLTCTKQQVFTYKIFVGFLDKIAYPQNLKQELKLVEVSPFKYRQMKLGTTNRYESANHTVCTMNFQDYRRFINEFQLDFYDQTNYPEFFTFVKKILALKKDNSLKIQNNVIIRPFEEHYKPRLCKIEIENAQIINK